jgi:hypothetical protein
MRAAAVHAASLLLPELVRLGRQRHVADVHHVAARDAPVRVLVEDREDLRGSDKTSEAGWPAGCV